MSPRSGHLRLVVNNPNRTLTGAYANITNMRLDHVSYAACPDGLDATAERLGEALGIEPLDGGYHPTFGTRNKIIPLCDGRYIEVVEVLEHPAADKVPFGQAVRARSALGGGWMGWVVATGKLERVEERLGRQAVPGRRTKPDGTALEWDQIGVKGLIADPQLPFIIRWKSSVEVHPSRDGLMNGVGMRRVRIAGDPQRVLDWLGGDEEFGTHGVDYEFTAPHGTPGLLTVGFETAKGFVEL